MISDWTYPFSLVTPEGTLLLNWTDPDSGRRFQLNPAKCNASLPIRSTEDDVPQGDGKIPHRRWRSGYGAHLAIEPLIAPVGASPYLVDPYGEASPACDGDLVDMLDLLGLHLNAMIRTGLVSGLPNARLIWTPTGHANRMLDRCQYLAAAIPQATEGSLGGTQLEFDIDSPYPYYISEAETQTVIYDGGTASVVNVRNEGNTDGFLVAEVFGPSDAFILENLSITDLDNVPLHLAYSDALPGADDIDAGDWIEFDFFTGRANLNGNQANRRAGIDYRQSTYFPLIPGDNLLACIGANALIKSNDYWA